MRHIRITAQHYRSEDLEPGRTQQVTSDNWRFTISVKINDEGYIEPGRYTGFQGAPTAPWPFVYDSRKDNNNIDLGREMDHLWRYSTTDLAAQTYLPEAFKEGSQSFNITEWDDDHDARGTYEYWVTEASEA